jgi:hypothetical protein
MPTCGVDITVSKGSFAKVVALVGTFRPDVEKAKHMPSPNNYVIILYLKDIYILFKNVIYKLYYIFVYDYS